MKRIMLLILVFVLTDCNKSEDFPERNYRELMREFVIKISNYAKTQRHDFKIIPQNGQEIIYTSRDLSGDLAIDYINAIDGTGREDLFYGYDKDNKATPSIEKEYLIDLCRSYEQNKLEVLAIDYCSDPDKISDSYTQNALLGFISFAAPARELNVIPEFPVHPYNENDLDIENLNQAKNFLYLINGENYESKADIISALVRTNYDLIIIDLFHNSYQFSSSDLNSLKTKRNGGSRLVIAYMSVGEAEDYRYYWNSEWKITPPAWLEKENPNWKGNYKVKYWNEDWQDLIFGSSTSYLDKIIAAGFDGVYLDLIDAFEYFEENSN